MSTLVTKGLHTISLLTSSCSLTNKPKNLEINTTSVLVRQKNYFLQNMNDTISGSNAESEEEENSESEPETRSPVQNPPKPINTSPGALKLRSWLNKTLKIKMTDGRTLIGVFLCTDQDANIILGSCSEYLPPDPDLLNEDPRMLGLVMIPGKHIVTVHIDMNEFPNMNQNVLTENLDYV